MPSGVVAAPPAAQSALPAGSPLQDPPALASRGGVLETTLRVARTSYDVAGKTVEGMTYNGLVQLWRFANIGADVPYSITMGDSTFYVIAQDGSPQPAMTLSKTLEIAPGKRFDVLVVGPSAGSVPLMTNALAFGRR